MKTVSITAREFREISGFLYEKTGIYLADVKKYLVVHRLMKRLTALQKSSFSEYLEYLKDNWESETQFVIDNLTTNETFFFREDEHFKFLEKIIKSDFATSTRVRVWSAACSSGEEAYSAAMVLEENFNRGTWEIIASDISSKVLGKARNGIYVIERSDLIPEHYLKKYCLRGINSQEGNLIIKDSLRSKVRFMHINLYEKIPDIGMFDVIFLRNVMIYFDMQTRKKVLDNVLPLLKKGGYFIVSHTESLVGITNELEMQKQRSSIYRKI